MSLVTVFNVTNKELTQEFEETFREHAPMIYRTAYSVTRTPQDAEDIVQTLFLKLLRRGFPEGLKENPKAYLYRAAVNLSLNAVRVRDRHVPIADADSLKASAADEVPRADADTQRLVAKAITQLHPQVVEVLVPERVPERVVGLNEVTATVVAERHHRVGFARLVRVGYADFDVGIARCPFGRGLGCGHRRRLNCLDWIGNRLPGAKGDL